MVRARRTSVYLTRVPRRCRRHRTLWAERGRELWERKRDAGTAVTLPGLVRGPRGVAEPQTRLCAAGTFSVSSPLPSTGNRSFRIVKTLKHSQNDVHNEAAGSPTLTLLRPRKTRLLLP